MQKHHISFTGALRRTVGVQHYNPTYFAVTKPKNQNFKSEGSFRNRIFWMIRRKPIELPEDATNSVPERSNPFAKKHSSISLLQLSTELEDFILIWNEGSKLCLVQI